MLQSIPPYSKTKENPLLLKDDVGKPKPSTYNLPQDEFIYGKALQRDKEGAKEVSMTWKFHNESRDKDPARDFTKLNKMSVKQGLHQSNQFYDFRKANDARVPLKKGQNALPIELPEEEFRYGRKNRPSTPMKLVMGNSYGLEAEVVTLHQYKQRAESQESRVNYNSTVRSNKASMLFSEANHQKLATIQGKQEKELFKLTKFKTVQPKTNTNLKTKQSEKQQEEEQQDKQQ